MKQILKILLSFLVILLFLSVGTHISYAQENGSPQIMKVSPAILPVSLNPGSEQNFPIKINNLTDTALPLKISVSGFEPSDEDNGINFDSNSANPLEKWIHIDRTESILGPKESQIFNVTVNVPHKVPLGGYSAMIFFTPLNLTSAVPVNARIGVLALANVGVDEDINSKISVEEFKFDNFIYDKNPINLLLRVKNSSLNFANITPTLTVKPLFGPLKEFEMEEKIIFPGKIRRWQKSYTLENLTPGVYLAKMSVSLGNGEQIIKTEQFIVFPWKQALIVITSLLILIYLTVFRKRVTRALKIMFKGK